MSTHKHIDKICCAAVILSLLLTAVFMNGSSFGIQAASRIMGYENRLFDSSKVHSLAIVMNDWDNFIDTCQNEEYSSCTVVIDGESYKNVGIRAKGNTSLSNVAAMDSDRYSFKVEFDHYDGTQSYHGLDKLSLNNIIQDNTFLKDYLVYQLMGKFGADAPLCSYVYITVNGEDWGLYLAVEGVEESFLQRNYGSNYGELYKPDSMSFGGGRGNGKDFNMDDFDMGEFDIKDLELPEGMTLPEDMTPPDGFSMPEDMTPPDGFSMPEDMTPPDGFSMPEDMTPPEDASMPEDQTEFSADMDDNNLPSIDAKNWGGIGDMDGMGKDAFGGMGSSDVKLQYIDEDPSSYSNIFDNAKTDITSEDQERLIASLKTLSSYENLETVLNVEEVLRYFVVHNFVVNDDSYTGNMIHNYYLYEENGQLSMIPWDYNLAFGTFTGMDASSAVNDSIDFSDESIEDRPMLNWIFEEETYTEQYHQYFAEFIANFCDSGYISELIAQTAELIAPYVEKDPTKFCTYEEFERGVQTLDQFCQLRAESVTAQSSGTEESVDASSLTLSDMGTMNAGGMGGGGADRNRHGNDMPGMRGGNRDENDIPGMRGENRDE